MISLIPIPNDFNEINAQYKKFRQDTFKKLCESNETFIQAEESNLINSINQIIEESEKNNDENNDENCMRILIGAKTLSKYSIINQNLCQQYFSLINEQKFPKSIPKIRFFIKYVIKQIKNQISVKWEKFIHHFHQNFLILENGPQPVQNTLIYIDFLIQYAPNFAFNFSKNIFYHLFKTIKKYDFILDLNYDIVNYLNQNTDTFLENKRYFANYAIELLRKFFEKVKIIPNQSKEISGILKWESGIKKLATLAVILEKCQKSFLLDNIDLIRQCLIKIKSSDIEIEILKNRDFLLQSIITNQVNNEIIQKILSIQYDCNDNVICSQLQNVNLLINKKLLNLDYNEKIIQIILNCLKKFPLKKLIISIVFKMLNNWCQFNKSLKIDHELITCLNQQEIHYDCFEVIKLMIQNDSKTFKSSLLNSLDHSNLNIIKTLNFLNGLQKEQILDFIDDKIENRIFDLAYDTNENIRSVIPLIAVKISPNKLFSGNHLNHLINSLSSDPSEKVKISIIRCFNDHLSKENLNDFSELKEKFNDPIFANILRNLLLCFSFHNIQIETIKFVSKLSTFQSNQLDFSDVILPYYLDFFTSFSKNDSDACLNNDYSNFLPFKLLKISEMLPYIFDSFPQFYLKYFEPFYNYSMDFMNLVSNDLKCYKNLTNLTLDTTQSALHKLKFYSKIFCSFIKSFEVILKNDPNTIKPYFEDIIKFCFYKLPNGVDRAETEHILSLLEKVLYTIGLEEILQNEKIQRNIKELYTKVLNTGSRFISSNNHQHIFRILGFIGAQLPYEKPLPIYSDANEKEQFDINLQEIMMDNSDEQYNTMYYLICSNALFQILDNQSLSYFHLNSLETLADLLGSMPLQYKTNARKTFFDEKKFFKNHFSSCFNYFMKLFKKADKTDKKFFVNIFELMLGVNNKILAPYVDKFVDIFIDLWEYESIDLLKQLINQFGNLLESYLCRIIPLIQSCNNYDTIVDSLYFIYVKYYAFKNMKSTDINVIDIIINIAFNFEYFKAIHTLKKIFNSNSNELMNYANDIIKLCLKYLNKINNDNETDPSYLNDTVDLLCLLANLRTDYIPSIKKALENNEQLLVKFDNQCNKSIANFIKSSANDDNLTTKHPHFGSPSNQPSNSDASNKQHKKIGFAIMEQQSVEYNQGGGCIKTGTPPRKQSNKPANQQSFNSSTREDNLIQKHPCFDSPSTNASFSDQSGKSSNASLPNKQSNRSQKISFGFNQQPQTDASKNVSFGSQSQASSKSSSQSSGMSSPSQHRPQKISFGFNQQPQIDASKNVSFGGQNQASSESSSQSSGMNSPSQHRPQKISFGFNQQSQVISSKNESNLKNVSFGSQSSQSSNQDPAKSGTKKISFALAEPPNQQPAAPSKKPLFEAMASNPSCGSIKTGTPPRKASNEPKSSLKPSFSSIKDSPANQKQSKMSFGDTMAESFLTEEQTKLIEFIKSINVLNEISSLYIDQWLNELILFCIQNSSNSIIQKVCRIAKKNEILAISIFNISFHSIISSINLDLYKEIKKEISKVFLSILQYKKTSHHCKVILINLIEFLDRHWLPIEDPSDFPEMITSLFDNNNAISLRYSLLKFEKNKYKDYKTGLNDVEHAFMNSGLLDEYQEFSNIFGNQNIDNLPFIPIFSGAMTEKQKQEQMDKLNNWSPNIIPQIYKVESLIRNYWSAFPTERNEEKEKEIQLEIDKGFVSLAIEGGPHFSQGYTSVIPYIIYGQELTELTELYKNPQKDNFHLRFMNSSQIFSFLPPILFLRIATKEGLKDSLREKYEILTLCRQAKRWKMMKQYNDFFASIDKETPVEIEYEMLYYKIANGLELDEKDFELQNDNKESCYVENLDKLVAFQKAVYYSRESKHKSNKNISLKWKNVIYLCKYMNNNVEAINLMGKANLELFKLDKNSSFLNEAIICFIDSAKKSEKVRISNILLIISLLFAHYNQTDRGLHSNSIEDISEELNQIPLDFYVNVMSQIISYIPDLEEKRFKKYMVNLLTNIMEKFPQGVIYDYAYSLVSDNRTSQNVIISSPMIEVRQKLINNAQVQHIFSEAFDLINNLEKVNSDFISSLLDFLNNTINYLKDEHEDYENERFRNKEINFFFDHFVEPLKNYYGVRNQDPDADQDNVYNPNYKEKTMIDNFKDNFGQLEKLIDELFEFFNVETDSEKDHKIQIYGKLRSFINEVTKFKSKNFQSDISPSKLFKLCPDMEKMKDLSLPVFSTYQMNLYSNIFIQTFMNDFTEFSTLQRPKKIIIVGSDGHSYPFLLKKSEDLRSDQRVMIFHKFMNQFISTKIKTYAVIPLTSYFGAIQFVHETEGLSSMINCYREKVEKKKNKVNYSRYEHEYFRENFGKTQEFFDKLTSLQKIETFRNLIDNEHINDLRESFWHLTINSEMWLKFFENYSSTCAVTSIVGYIIGLGDRHLSNIMINKRDGSLMHIDFCDLFEKDQITQSYTEKVPFRLTPYMIKALGPCGFNGSFRYKCEETLSIIRENRYIIKNILKVFLDSPIVEAEARPFSLVTSLTLIKKRKKSNKKLIERISDKVNGTDTTFIYSSDAKIGNVEPISVNKQVDKLIKCATNELNLGCSFWEPWK